RYNDAFKRIAGSQNIELIGRNFLELFASGGGVTRSKMELELALKNVCQQKICIKLPPTPSGWFNEETDGDPRWWEIECCPFHDTSSDNDLIICTTWEITERIASNKARERTDRIQNMLLGIQEKMNDDLTEATERIFHAEADLKMAQASEERLHRMVMGTQAGMFVLSGKDLIIEIVNKPVTDLLQKSAEKLTGMPLLDAFPELSDQPLLALTRKVQQSGKPAAFLDLPVWFHHPDGSVRQQYIDCGITRVEEKEGREAIVISITDTTKVLEAKLQLQQSHKQLQQTEQLLQQAISTAEMGTWSIDFNTHSLNLSERLRQIFGLTINGEITVSEAMNAIDPEYRELVSAKIEAGLQRYEDIAVEYPLTNLQTGQRFWIRGTGKVFFNPDGKPAHFSGVFIDVTKS
ncbi:MAG: PAS domain S-box protein, partial [Chitinophagaceae bacterium]|nr:PAS domain S-box protein [Chitinophagaceae bacterium]